MEKKIRMKMHHWLLVLLLVLVGSVIGVNVYKVIKTSAMDFKSQYLPEDILLRLEKTTAERMLDLKMDFIHHTQSEDVGPVVLMIFKNEGRAELWLLKQKQKVVFPLSAISAGVGLKKKPTETIFPDGIYDIKEVGLNDKSGFFIRLDYPGEDLTTVDAESLRGDAILLSTRPVFPSHIVLEEEDMENLSYILLKMGYAQVKVLVFPTRPPIRLPLTSSQEVAEIYKALGIFYNQKVGDMNEQEN